MGIRRTGTSNESHLKAKRNIKIKKKQNWFFICNIIFKKRKKKKKNLRFQNETFSKRKYILFLFSAYVDSIKFEKENKNKTHIFRPTKSNKITKSRILTENWRQKNFLPVFYFLFFHFVYRKMLLNTLFDRINLCDLVIDRGREWRMMKNVDNKKTKPNIQMPRLPYQNNVNFECRIGLRCSFEKNVHKDWNSISFLLLSIASALIGLLMIV